MFLKIWGKYYHFFASFTEWIYANSYMAFVYKWECTIRGVLQLRFSLGKIFQRSFPVNTYIFSMCTSYLFVWMDLNLTCPRLYVLRLFPVLYLYKRCCNEHLFWHTCISISVGEIPKREVCVFTTLHSDDMSQTCHF